MPTLPASSKPGEASGRTRRQSSTDKEALAALEENDVVEFMRGAVEASNAAKQNEANFALQSARLQAEVAERQAERQINLTSGGRTARAP